MNLEERKRKVLSQAGTEHMPTAFSIVVRCPVCGGEKKVYPPVSDLHSYKNNGDGTFTAPWGKCSECIEWEWTTLKPTAYLVVICLVLIATSLLVWGFLH